MLVLKDNIESVKSYIAEQEKLQSRKIYLVGACKTMSADIINEGVELGVDIIAENKAQEFRDKYPLISKKATHHFIGHLQTNKIKYIIGKVELIHSVDRDEIALEIEKQSAKLNITTNILLEVNVCGEESKSGYPFDSVKEALIRLSNLKNVKIKGLMTMFKKDDSEENIKALCIKMRELYEELKQSKEGENFEFLSMGMSADYKIAVENGSNMIRLGSSIYGKRDYDI